MEHWEHMYVRSAFSASHGEIGAVGPDGEARAIDAEDGSLGRIVRALAELGAEGWQLVSSEVSNEDAERVRVFWLKRRVASSNDEPQHLAFGL